MTNPGEGLAARRGLPPCIVWDVTVGPVSCGEILFVAGDEDPDHMVAAVDLPPVRTREEAWAACRHVVENLSIEQVAELKTTARAVSQDTSGLTEGGAADPVKPVVERRIGSTYCLFDTIQP